MGTNAERVKKGRIAQAIEHLAGDNGPAEWTNCEPQKLIDAICAAGAAGGALRFGYSPDGGSYAIGIYGDGDPYTVYVRPSEDLDRVLDSITTAFGDMGFTATNPTPKPQKGR